MVLDRVETERGELVLRLCDGRYEIISNGVFLMASIIERFLGLYASVNSFSRLTALVRGRSGKLKTWPARAGDRILL